METIMETVAASGRHGLLTYSTAALLCTVLIIALVIHRLYLHPLSKFPGPKAMALSRFPYLISTVKGTIVSDLVTLHEKYGEVIRIAPNELSFNTPEAARTIYQSNPELAKDPMHLPPFHNGAPGILAADKEHHSRYRRLLAYGFSDKGMRAQQPLIQRHIDLLLRRLKERSNKGSQDIVEWFNWCTFDIIGDLAFGESFNCLGKAATHEWIASIQGNVKAIPIINAIRRLKLDWIIPLLAPKKLLQMRQRNAQFTEDKVDQRLRCGADRGDLWDTIVGSSGKASMSRQEMISNASAIVLAGSETSATLLSGAVWLLGRHPEALQQLEQHIRSAYRSEDEIDLISVGKLDFLGAVLDETLRLYPPVPMQSNRVVNRSGANIAGYAVPGGTSVALQQFAACRSSANFYRPNDFLPQRWLCNASETSTSGSGIATGSEFAGDRRAASQPFSIGPRNCIGRQLAYAEMRLILARMVWNFDISLDDSKMGNDDWLGKQGVWILWDKSPLWVQLRTRNY